MKDIKAEPLNKFVADILASELKSRKDFKKIISQVNQNDEIDILLNRLKGNKQALQNNLHLYEQSPSKAIKNKIEKLLEDSKILHQRILEAQSRFNILNADDTDKICKCFKNTLMTSDDLDVRNYIKKAVNKIVVDDNEVSIVLN